MKCLNCDEWLSQARLAAMPRAKYCVPCLELLGDVPKIKRFDEEGFDGEVTSTFFTSNPYIESHILRSRFNASDDAVLEQLVGDDSFLEREDSRPDNVHAYPMSEAFESDED